MQRNPCRCGKGFAMYDCKKIGTSKAFDMKFVYIAFVRVLSIHRDESTNAA